MILLMLSMGWAQSNDWKAMIWAQVKFEMRPKEALPPLLDTARELSQDVEQWQIIDTGVDFSKEPVSRYFIHDVVPGGGVAPLLQGMSSLIERSSLQLTPRPSPWWDEVSVSSYMPEGISYQQLGTTRYYKDGELEAISVDTRYWNSELSYMYSAYKYTSYWVLRRHIFIYRKGIAVGAYVHELNIELNPSYTDEEWESHEKIRNPDWVTLLANPEVHGHEHIFTFHYNEEGSLNKVELFEYAKANQPRYVRYEPIDAALIDDSMQGSQHPK